MTISLGFMDNRAASVSYGRKRVRTILNHKATPAVQTKARRPHQTVESFSNMSEKDRDELAAIFEAELARL